MPTQLGRYQVLKHLATGGMAEVLLARAYAPDGSQPYFVIKRIRGEQAQDHRFVRMFVDEAMIASSLHHPNIVRVFEIGEARGEYFFAMEYIHGEDLRQVLAEINRRDDKLPIAQVLGMMSAVALGLHYAHEARGADGTPLGLVHRDVSPANILVGYDGSVKIVDFGIAKATLHTAETRSGTLKGKVSYMSPEQVTGRPIDRRSDVFALGIVLYEVVTARRLFKGENDFLTMSAIVQGDIPPPSRHRADVPKPLEDIIMKALANEPSDRYQSADDLRLAMERFMTSIGLRASPAGIADFMKKLFGHRPEPWLVDGEPSEPHSIDFDGSGRGVVVPPEAAVQRFALPRRVTASALIVLAHNEVAASPYTPETGHQFRRPSTEAVPVLPVTPVPGSRPQRRSWLIRGAVAVVAVAGIVVAAKTITGGPQGSAPPAAETQPMVARPAEDTPAEKPAPAEVAPTPVEVAPAVSPVPAEPPPPAAAKVVPRPAPVETPPDKKPRKRPARPAPRPDPKPEKWDPNALFPK